MKRRDLVVAGLVFVGLWGALLMLGKRARDVDLPERPYAVRIDAAVYADARAKVVVAPNGASRDVVGRVAQEMAESLLGGRVTKAHVGGEDGRAYAVVFLRDVFEPGRDAQVNLHAVRAYELAADRGWEQPELRLLVPRADRVEPRWVVRPSAWPSVNRYTWVYETPPTGVVRLTPAVGRAWVTTALMVVAAVAAFLGISLWPRRRARGRFACGALALVCGLACVPIAAFPADNLVVAGVGGRSAYAVFQILVIVWLVATLTGLWLLLTPRRRATMPA